MEKHKACRNQSEKVYTAASRCKFLKLKNLYSRTIGSVQKAAELAGAIVAIEG
jgi:hypothetical protein